MTIRQQYFKERKRIERYVANLEKQGADVLFSVPSIPKTITKASVRRLQRITPDRILDKTYAYDISRKSYVSGRAVLGAKQRRSIATKEQQYEILKKERYLSDIRRETENLIETNAKHLAEPIKEVAEFVLPELIPEIEAIDELPKMEDIILDNTFDELSRQTGVDLETGEILDEEAYRSQGDLLSALAKLKSYTPKEEWQKSRWYAERKQRQINKLIEGITDAIDAHGKNAVAKKFNENASEFNRTIERAIFDSGSPSELDQIDVAIDDLVFSLFGVMSYEDAEEYGY